jgi:hypothetical protein
MSWRLRLITLASLVIIVLLTLSYHEGRQGQPSLADRVLLEAVASLQNGVIVTARAVEDFWRGYFYLVNLRDENESLYRTLNRMRSQVNRLREAAQDNKRYRLLLDFKSQFDYEMKGAHVVAWDPTAWFKTIVVTGLPGRSAGRLARGCPDPGRGWPRGGCVAGFRQGPSADRLQQLHRRPDPAQPGGAHVAGRSETDLPAEICPEE